MSKLNIRKNVFDTNSSSCHNLTIVTKNNNNFPIYNNFYVGGSVVNGEQIVEAIIEFLQPKNLTFSHIDKDGKINSTDKDGNIFKFTFESYISFDN